MNLKDLSDSELLSQTKCLVQEERNSTSKVLRYLREIEVRRLYVERGYQSLFAFCMGCLGYDGDETQKRIAAMRLVRDVPAIETKVVTGELTLTVLNKAQVFFNQRAKDKKPLGLEEKTDILKILEGKSVRQCERELIRINPNPLPKKMESQRLITEDLTELKVVLERKTMETLERLKELLSHQDSHMKTADLIDKLAEQMLLRIDPERKPAKKTEGKKKPGTTQKIATIDTTEARGVMEAIEKPNEPTTANTNGSAHGMSPAPEQVKRYIPKQIKQAVWQRDGGVRSYVDPLTKKKCGSRFKVQFDHINPHSMGGANSMDNLRLYCQAHNLFHATQIFGKRKMRRFIPRLEM